MMPPQKPKVRKLEKPDTTTKSKSKPGSISKRPAPKSSRTLERVLSKETERNRRSMSRGPSGVIALMRSASTPMLKRENSEPLSMMSIPKADSSTSKERASRPPLAAPVKRRSEGDKAKKEALLQTELQDAISALRRPNREVVGKAMAEADERRAITSLSSLRSKYSLDPPWIFVILINLQSHESQPSTHVPRILSKQLLPQDVSQTF